MEEDTMSSTTINVEENSKESNEKSLVFGHPQIQGDERNCSSDTKTLMSNRDLSDTKMDTTIEEIHSDSQNFYKEREIEDMTVVFRTENDANNLDMAKIELLKALEASNEKSPNEDLTEIQTSSKDEMKTQLLASFQLGKDNFFKGCKWAPDGLCLMTNSDDNIIRLYNTPDQILQKNFENSQKIEVCLKLKEAETIYDYTWWPQMNSMYPATCCLATTAKDQPIHLWDAFNGDLRASYIPKNNVDEIAAANSIAFSPDGLQMICGFSKELRLFYIDRPGDQCEKWPTRKHKCSTGQRGIISTAEFHPDGSIIACGSYDGTVATYSTKNGELIGIFNAKNKGITQVKFSPDGNRLYSGSRKDNTIVCWDVRFMKGDLFHLKREVETNQRIYFDAVPEINSNQNGLVTESMVLSGGTDGMVSFWDVGPALKSENSSNYIDPVYRFKAHNDCTNGVHFHPYLPVLATSSGQRHYRNDISDSEGDESQEIEENTIKLWHVTGLVG